MIEKILRFALRHPVVVVIFTLIAGGFGVYSLLHLPIDAVPDITNNQVQINTEFAGFSPLQMEKQVTYTIETAIAGIPGLQMTRSMTRNGFSQVTAVFDDSVNIYFARQQINERLSAIKENLPDGVEPRMGPISTGLGEIYMWTVDYLHPGGRGALIKEGRPGWQSDGSYLTQENQRLVTDAEKASYLRTVQDWIIRPQLKSVPGLADIDTIGGYVRQYHIEPSIEKMTALRISFHDIMEALKRNNLSIGPGYIEKGGEAFLIKADARFDHLDSIGAVVLATKDAVPIRIKDIAQIGIGKEMRTGSATKDGEEVVIGTALMLIGANSRIVSQAVDQKLKEINQTLPSDIEAKTVINRTKLVNATIHTVAKNLGEGAFLVIAVLFAFLGYFRAALITALVIPLSMLLTAIGMVESKISGNLMSLGAIDFGLIVDGAIIITENCLRRLFIKQEAVGRDLTSDERKEEIMAASKEMIQPSVYGQAIIIVVYFPMLALSGVEGKMFHPMAMTVIFALISAFVLSLTLIPAMITIFIKGPFKAHENAIIRGAKAVYRPLLNQVLEFPWIMIGASFVLVVLSGLLFARLGEEFIPTLDEQDIALQALRIPSTSLTQSTEMQMQLEKSLSQIPEVAYVYSKTGTAEMASDPMPPNLSDTFVILKSRQEWSNPHLAKGDLIKNIEAVLLDLPGQKYEFTQPIEMRFNELISGSRSDVAVKIYGDHFETMQKSAEKIANVLNSIKGAADVKIDQTSGLPILDILVNHEMASRVGLNAADILEVISIAMGGGKAGELFEGDRRFDIIVKLPEYTRGDLDALAVLPIPLPSDIHLESGSKSLSYIPLKKVAALELSEGLNEIKRENGKRFVSVEANVRGTDLGTFVEQAKRKIASKVIIPKGYWIGWGGQFENFLSAKNRLFLVVPICFGLIFLLLFAACGDLKDALLVFTGIPLALTGGIAALWLRDIPFSISAAVGFIALSGIAVLNGLVLITSINGLMKEGVMVKESIAAGALNRLRPVLMTALVASLGFVPMALATGTGAEVQKPLATVVIGGLISATLLTLLVLPALLQVFRMRKQSICQSIHTSQYYE